MKSCILKVCLILSLFHVFLLFSTPQKCQFTAVYNLSLEKEKALICIRHSGFTWFYWFSFQIVAVWFTCNKPNFTLNLDSNPQQCLAHFVCLAAEAQSTNTHRDSCGWSIINNQVKEIRSDTQARTHARAPEAFRGEKRLVIPVLDDNLHDSPQYIKIDQPLPIINTHLIEDELQGAVETHGCPPGRWNPPGAKETRRNQDRKLKVSRLKPQQLENEASRRHPASQWIDEE